MSSFPLRCTILGQLALGAWLILVGIGNWAHAHSAQVLSWYIAFLPLLVFLAILFFSDWLGEYVMGSWGIWEARRDLSRLADDLAVLEAWRLGGGLGVRVFLVLFWLGIFALAAFGILFLFSGVFAFTGTHAPWLHSTVETVLNIFLACLILIWSGYAAFLLFYRRKYPGPPIPADSEPKVASLSAWRKERLLRNKEEAIAFLALFHEACPEVAKPRGFPWKILLFTIPEFCWHFYRWTGGEVSLPQAASASIGLFGAGMVFFSLWRMVPWALAQTSALLHPERVSCCKYLPILRLRELAEKLAS
ncbi:MAG: hypothetical protein WCY91_02140 [Acidithiobacillus sp.]|uniref:Uncharacterized protein n=2 Tax=Acidithiobacillus TaxID=119977 RepID=A0ACD5IHJ8_9PROT|nr:hypothetical protein [Acidithiobacillus ferruginosus]MDD2746393.1 hypothetical protein [Acidithiobacillus ferrooxidans]MDD5002843.1 hypothetical protein [Acidithiobacillus sp.]MBU2813587.1 hypothetical protein [Acidithiobacillus ferruginosus]MDD5379574.1 hypothetical protein [Acidithiobacillus sp.]MDD5575866.1 hypothetical protein [Acidithiobacillus sp.]